MIQRAIPSTDELLPVTGLGTWQAFDVSRNDYPRLKNVITNLKEAGAKLIDSSPMYGRAEEVIGDIIQYGYKDFFYATKVWTRGREEGIKQMQASIKKLRSPVIDLMQIHNLVDWKIHLSTLREWKEAGLVRYIGITHYTDSMHEELEKILEAETIDFVQFNYSITDRNAEKTLLPLAAEKGVATLINRPFGEGAIFSKIKDKPLPAWSKELEISTWSQFLLKFIIAHPAVTCVIPGTGDAQHVTDNAKAGDGLLPDEKWKEKMVAYIKSI